MIALLWVIWAILASPFKSKWQLEVENVALRHQLIVLRRQVRGRVRLTNLDRLVLVQLYRWFPSILKSSLSFSRKLSFAGIGPVFAAIGGGNPGRGEGDRPSRPICAR